MKTEDFDRLKQICEKEGFELLNESPFENDKFFVVKKKDPWEGVEFVESKYSSLIYRVQDIELGHDFKPSTEQAYIEQLKQQAFERFGEIKDGDRFERSWIDGAIINTNKGKAVWIYIRTEDALYYSGFEIYKKGKWATKIENIDVKVISATVHKIKIDNKQVFEISFESSKPLNKNFIDIYEHLAEQLTKYLNERPD